MKIFFKQIILFSLLLFSISVAAEGFLAGTLVKTSTCYVPIEDISIGDTVVCCDDNGRLVQQPVIFIAKQSILNYIKIYVNDECLCVAKDQLFFCATTQKWIAASALNKGDVLKSGDNQCCIVQEVKNVNEVAIAYLLTIAEFHNFCVSQHDIVVHNLFPFVIAGFAGAFGLGGIELSSFSLGLIVGGIFCGYSLLKKHHKSHKKYGGNVVIEAVSISGNMFPEDPEEKKRRRDVAREKHSPLTNKEAREQAKKLGYIEVKDHPCGGSHSIVFKRGDRYISPDVDGHKGGIWKMFNRKGFRLSTWNIDLTKMVGQ